MNRRDFIKRTALTGLLAAGSRLAFGDTKTNNPAGRPNVLFIAVDDWNDWLGCLGYAQAITPNIDALAKRGVIFTHAQCQAAYCAPSRASLMTGMYPHTTGCYRDEPFFAEANRPDIVDLPHYFKKNGYKTHGGGKLYHHMHAQINMKAWDYYFCWSEKMKERCWAHSFWSDPAPRPNPYPYAPAQRKKYEKFREKLSKTLSKDELEEKLARKNFMGGDYAPLANADEEKMSDTITTNWACRFLGEKHEKPFFLGFGLYAPHKPNYAPQKYFDLYPPDKIELPEIPENDLDDIPRNSVTQKAFDRMRDEKKEPVSEDEKKAKVRGYLASLSYADAMVGRVLDALEKSPYRDSTIVVFWSDNGYHHGEKFCYAKHTLWERVSNVPLILAGPGVSSGVVVDKTVELLDIYPTLVSLCGLPAQKGLDGDDLSPVLKKPSSAEDKAALQYFDDGFAVIDRDWRYIRYKDNSEELYDLQKDPHEWKNLAANADYAHVIAKMRSHIPEKRAPRLKGLKYGLKYRQKGDLFEWVETKK